MRAHGLCARDVPNNAVVRKKESRSFDLNDLERYYCAWAELPFEFSTHLSLSLSCQICQLPGPHVFPTFVELPNSLAANDWRMGLPPGRAKRLHIWNEKILCAPITV